MTLRAALGLIRPAAAILLLLASSGCATRPPESDPQAVAAYEEANDPWEPFNRVMWDINWALDRAILRPVTWVYRQVVPPPVRGVVSNIYANSRMPLVIVNAMLQGDFDRAGTATGRFLLNTTVGLGGIADPATEAGLETIDEDFGQTLAVWGVPSGPYLVLPVIGPTNPRDTVGFVAESVGDPVGIALDEADVDNLRLGWTVGNVVDARSRNWEAINEIFKADDPYVFARSAFRQRREFLISNGEITQSEEEQELFEQDFEDFGDFPQEDGDGEDGAEPDAGDTPLPRFDQSSRALQGPDFALR